MQYEPSMAWPVYQLTISLSRKRHVKQRLQLQLRIRLFRSVITAETRTSPQKLVRYPSILVYFRRRIKENSQRFVKNSLFEYLVIYLVPVNKLQSFDSLMKFYDIFLFMHYCLLHLSFGRIAENSIR